MIGTVAGTVLGVILALTISDIISWFNNVLGLILFDAYFVHYLPSYLRWQDVTIIVIVSLLLSFLATIYPALRAAKVQPAEALRYE
ncbi:Lipoprotein-releasing system transmembrane protein LolE [compost metagenome]